MLNDHVEWNIGGDERLLEGSVLRNTGFLKNVFTTNAGTFSARDHGPEESLVIWGKWFLLGSEKVERGKLNICVNTPVHLCPRGKLMINDCLRAGWRRRVGGGRMASRKWDDQELDVYLRPTLRDLLYFLWLARHSECPCEGLTHPSGCSLNALGPLSHEKRYVGLQYTGNRCASNSYQALFSLTMD